MKNVKYNYGHLSIPGGGFVTGYVYHPVTGTLYCRTDIGGCYRYEHDRKKWISLIDHSDYRGIAKMETFPLSIAVNSGASEEFYVACGDGKKGMLCISKDRGAHFCDYFEIPAAIHGNHSGRGTGERLVVDGNAPQVIYFGSQHDGLLRSEDGGRSWKSVVLGVKNETEITFVYIDERFRTSDGRSARIFVATTGERNTPDGKQRGPGLYYSVDGGKEFKVFRSPEQKPESGANVCGYVGVRMTKDDLYYYISFTSSGPWEWCGFSNYAPDSNDSYDGKLCRYRLEEDGSLTEFADITPGLMQDKLPDGCKGLGCGVGGVSVSLMHPGQILVSSINRGSGDMVVRSEDYGNSWKLEVDHDSLERFRVTIPYLKAEYNGGVMPLHWLTSLEINPVNPSEALFNTGIGIYMTHNLQSEASVWETESYGVEETVHLNLYSPPSGDAMLIDIVGDLGGFIFKDTGILPENSFADEVGNRYITCCNADYPDDFAEKLVVSARGNWTGKTKGGLIYSENQGESFRRLACPYGITEHIDRLLTEIEKPNVNSGWGAISADGSVIVWTVGDRNALPINAVVYTEDYGRSWKRSVIYDLNKEPVKDETVYPKKPKLRANDYDAFWKYQESITGMKVMSDRVNPKLFFGLGDASKFYVSEDGAKSFRQIPVEAYADGQPAEFPVLGLAGIDMSYHGEARMESQKTGVLWLAMEEGGLWKLVYDADNKKFLATRITKEGDSILAQGMGKGITLPDGSCPCKALYVGGTIQGEYGFYRSFDEGKNWERINTGTQMFGDLKYMTGDPRRFGRVYIATGTRGILWGDPAEQSD